MALMCKAIPIGAIRTFDISLSAAGVGPSSLKLDCLRSHDIPPPPGLVRDGGWVWEGGQIAMCFIFHNWSPYTPVVGTLESCDPMQQKKCMDCGMIKEEPIGECHIFDLWAIVDRWTIQRFPHSRPNEVYDIGNGYRQERACKRCGIKESKTMENILSKYSE